MKGLRNGSWVCAWLATVFLALASFPTAGPGIGVGLLLLTVVWHWAERQERVGALSVVLAAWAYISAVAALLDAPWGLVLPGLLLALAAWDLAAFSARYRQVNQVQPHPALMARHSRHLAAALLIGGAVGSLPRLAELRLGFWVSLALASAILWGFGSMIRVSSRAMPPRR